MNSISYRIWDIWVNNTLLPEKKLYHGYFECVITPTLMALQTVEFLYENYQLQADKEPLHVDNRPRELQLPAGYSRQFIVNEKNELCIKLYGYLDMQNINEELIKSMLVQLDAISVCVDISLNCNKISFVDNNAGTIFYATRRSLGRGMAFEVEERIDAKQKMEKDYLALLELKEPSFLLSIKHYLAGMNLLGLEDQFPGLIEAAFMQFYLGCEAICQTNKCEEAKKRISNLDVSDNRNLQIIAHQVWQVRNEYFGHGTEIKHNAAINFRQSSNISKQVLVARYLGRRLIDSNLPSNEVLVREIGLYPNGYAESFNGNVNELSNNFYVAFSGRNVKIYAKDNLSSVETYFISSKE